MTKATGLSNILFQRLTNLFIQLILNQFIMIKFMLKPA